MAWCLPGERERLRVDAVTLLVAVLLLLLLLLSL
jgi:hypothetical protein